MQYLIKYLYVHMIWPSYWILGQLRSTYCTLIGFSHRLAFFKLQVEIGCIKRESFAAHMTNVDLHKRNIVFSCIFDLSDLSMEPSSTCCNKIRVGSVIHGQLIVKSKVTKSKQVVITSLVYGGGNRWRILPKVLLDSSKGLGTRKQAKRLPLSFFREVLQ
jgi:hypothetical protein